MANVVVSALATWNGRALKKAKQDVSVFDKQLKNFAKSVGVAFSATKIISFSKKAVKAFAEDEVAAKSLALQLENTGNAFRVTEVEAYIKSLEKTNAILTDLRAPFQTLLNVTGSVELAQRSLEAALDISAGTGQSLTTVIGAISAGARGQTKAIRGLNTGIDESILATGDMNKIMEELERRFAGQAAARLDTYTGKMDALKKSADEASKTIGEGLVDALVILSEDNTIENLSSDMEDFATAIADTIRGIAKLTKKIQEIPGVNKIFTLEGIPVLGSYLEAFRKSGAQSRMQQTEDGGKTRAARRLELRSIKDSVKFRKQENDQLKKKTAVDELAAKFDLERIGLTTALNQATDEETKLRLKAQLAILDNNEALAKKLLAEMEATEGLKKFTDALEASTNKYDTMISTLIGQFRALGLSLQESLALAGMSARYQAQADAFAAGRNGAGSAAPQMSNDPYDILVRQLAPELNTSYGLSAQEAISLATSSARYQAQADAITLRIDASGDKMSQAIAESIQQATRNGFSTSAAGQLP
jgi:hypothetical protein